MKNDPIVYSSQTVTASDIQRGQLVWVDGIYDPNGRRLNECNRVYNIKDGQIFLMLEYLADNETGVRCDKCLDRDGILRAPGRISIYEPKQFVRKISRKGNIWWRIKKI